MKAINCFKCQFYFPVTDWDGRYPCDKGHKPRFYKGKGLRWEPDNAEHWGHKRVCTDFVARPTRPKFIVEIGYATRRTEECR